MELLTISFIVHLRTTVEHARFAR